MRTTATPDADSESASIATASILRRLREAWLTVWARAAAPVPAASCAAFRIALGLAVAWMAIRFAWMRRIELLLVDPPFHFHYPGFEWVAPLPAPALYAVHGVMVVAGLAIALGWRYRVACAVFLVAFVYVEAIDAALYLNHYELVTLVALLASVLPLHAGWSLDARAGRVAAPSVVPAVVVWLLRFQLGVVYVFAGIGKVNTDWLFHGEPLHTWLAGRTDQWLVGPVLASFGLALALSWAGALFDLTIVGWLLWRRTRLLAYAALVVFHVLTARLFPAIGVFPWVMIALTPIFFAPDWPSLVARRFHGGGASSETAVMSVPSVHGRFAEPTRDSAVRATLARTAIAVLILTYCAVQIVVPLRHIAYPGDVRWTEEGYRWSWRVLLTEKTGTVRFLVEDPITGRTRVVWPGDELADHQERYLAIRPHALVEYAHHLAHEEAARTGVRPIVRADSWVSINGSRRARLVDPVVDLAAVHLGFGPSDWIAPRPR